LTFAFGRRFALLLAMLGCAVSEDVPDPLLQPDEVLRGELGLASSDRVHRVVLAGSGGESAEPALVSVAPEWYVEFVTADWLVHEVIFEVDSLTPAQRLFLEGTDQVASPPLAHRDSRYVLAFEGAPPGRYPYRLEGNGRPGSGAIVVTDEELP